MSKSLEDALNENAWSVSAVIFDLDAILDDEGRPISERRADAMARVGVEMEMRECPFGGIREDKWMNVSALTQITHYFNDVLAEIAAFRRQSKGEHATWEEILECIVELLAGPAIFLLQQRNSHSPVPAQVAVGHKLAAGMFDVLRSLHQRLALGASIPVTVNVFMELVDELEALVGTSEACAGSPKMIEKVSTVLLEGGADKQIELDPLRLEIARCLALQVQLGIFWHLYDQVHLWQLLQGEFSKHLVPFNDFLTRKIESARNDLNATKPQRPKSDMLPTTLEASLCQRLADALNDAADPITLEEDLRIATELHTESGSPIHYNGAIEPFVQSVANYLNTSRLIKAELNKVELELREHLGFPSKTPIRLGAAVFPSPQAQPWYELILGRRLDDDGRLKGKSVKVVKLNK